MKTVVKLLKGSYRGLQKRLQFVKLYLSYLYKLFSNLFNEGAVVQKILAGQY